MPREAVGKPHLKQLKEEAIEAADRLRVTQFVKDMILQLLVKGDAVGSKRFAKWDAPAFSPRGNSLVLPAFQSMAFFDNQAQQRRKACAVSASPWEKPRKDIRRPLLVSPNSGKARLEPCAHRSSVDRNSASTAALVNPTCA